MFTVTCFDLEESSSGYVRTTYVYKVTARILGSQNAQLPCKHMWFYINKIQQDATVCRYLFTAKLLKHVSGVHRTHHQEYIKL